MKINDLKDLTTRTIALQGDLKELLTTIYCLETMNVHISLKRYH